MTPRTSKFLECIEIFKNKLNFTSIWESELGKLIYIKRLEYYL